LVGLLFGVDAARAASVHDGFKRRGESCWEIGEVTKEPRIVIV
jgi:phosphoribosylaminoimidazole (AIR) synthetase